MLLKFYFRLISIIFAIVIAVLVLILFPEHINAYGIFLVFSGTIFTLNDHEQDYHKANNLFVNFIRMLSSSNMKMGVLLISSGCILNFSYDIIN